MFDKNIIDPYKYIKIQIIIFFFLHDFIPYFQLLLIQMDFQLH